MPWISYHKSLHVPNINCPLSKTKVPCPSHIWQFFFANYKSNVALNFIPQVTHDQIVIVPIVKRNWTMTFLDIINQNSLKQLFLTWRPLKTTTWPISMFDNYIWTLEFWPRPLWLMGHCWLYGQKWHPNSIYCMRSPKIAI